MKKRIPSALSLLILIIASLAVLYVTIEPAQSSTTNITISGHVYDTQGNAVSHAYTFLVDTLNDRSAANCYTNSSGFYSLTVPAGTYSIVSYLTGSSLSYCQRNMTLNSDTLKDIQLVVGFKVTGQVLDQSGNAIAGAIINVFNSTWFSPGGRTNSSGYYTLYAPNGSYTFIIWPPLNSNLMDFKNSTVAVTSDMTYNIVMDRGYVVSGNVQYPSGAKASGVSTFLTNSTGYPYSSGYFSDSMPTPGTYSIAVPAGTYTLSAKLNSVLVYLEPNVVVNGDVTKDMTLISVSISPNIAIMDVGQSYEFKATATGGSGTYISYTWSVNGSAIIATSTPTFSFTPTEEGTYIITAVAKDNQGASSTQSTTATVTTKPALIPSQLSISPSQIDPGQTSVLNATEASAGTAPYSYQWYSKAPSATNYSIITGATALNYTFTTTQSTEAGKWRFVLNATDNASTPATMTSNVITVTVNTAPSVSISPASANLIVGQSSIFSATAAGGSGNYTAYQWYVNGAAQTGQTSTSFSYSPPSTGSYSITATVTDSLGTTSNQSAAAQLQVSPEPTPTPTITQNPTVIPASSSPTATQNTTQAPLTGTYVIISIALAVVVVALIGYILLSKRTSKAKKS